MGTAIVPAAFRDTRRHKADADQIDVALLDSDSGATLGEIATAVLANGWAAIIASTHSHLTRITQAKRIHWETFHAKRPSCTEAAYLVEVKGMLPHVAAGALLDNEDEEHVYFRHGPCAKFRIAIPLLRPWCAANYPTQEVANAIWKERIEALAAALQLQHDQACCDTARLFFLPRRPSNGPPPETRIVEGALCDVFVLPQAGSSEPLFSNGRARRGANGDNGGTDDWAEHAYIDPDTSAVFDLVTWARTYGNRLLIAKALRTRRPTVLAGRVANHVKIHIECPNSAEHTQ
jgi:hypothetical protein